MNRRSLKPFQSNHQHSTILSLSLSLSLFLFSPEYFKCYQSSSIEVPLPLENSQSTHFRGNISGGHQNFFPSSSPNCQLFSSNFSFFLSVFLSLYLSQTPSLFPPLLSLSISQIFQITPSLSLNLPFPV